MIDPASLHPLGTLGKPIGYKGALYLHSDYDIEAGTFIFLIMDGLPVPYLVTEVKVKGADLAITLKGIDDDKAAAALNKKEVYSDEKPETEDDGIVYLSDLAGYRLMNGDTELGTIARMDDSTENVLLYVSTGGDKEIIIPAAEDLMTALDAENKILTMDLPEGLINLND